MKKEMANILSFTGALLIGVSPMANAATKTVRPFLETRVDRDKIVEGEKVIYEVVLYTPSSSVAGVELLTNPGFGSFPVTPSSADSNLTRIVRDGTTYYTAVIDRYFVDLNENGKFSFSGADYRLGLNRVVQENDPFWGPISRNRVEVIDLKAPDLSIKVSELPKKNRPDSFSGGVGEFEVKTYLPKGEIRSGEDAYMIVTLSGIGDLSDAELPDIVGAFPDGLQFKSMTHNRQLYIKDGKIGSEIEIECVFHPLKEGEYNIKGISFTFFNPRSGKYETVTSKPLEVEVKYGLPGKNGRPQIMDV